MLEHPSKNSRIIIIITFRIDLVCGKQHQKLRTTVSMAQFMSAIYSVLKSTIAIYFRTHRSWYCIFATHKYVIICVTVHGLCARRFDLHPSHPVSLSLFRLDISISLPLSIYIHIYFIHHYHFEFSAFPPSVTKKTASFSRKALAFALGTDLIALETFTQHT